MNFEDLGVSKLVLKALSELGYETPTPVQEQSIPALLDGQNLLAQAQTGTGKTAAFALPILAKVKLKNTNPQVLVLTPTRELAIQVAEAFHSYAKYLKGFYVLPIYGGAEFRPQLRALKRGVHVVVGTPGRVMDHIRRESLSLEDIQTVILDEADEMLNMGFIDDVKWILEQIHNLQQTALFSATMPFSIRKIAKQYLKDATQIHIKPHEATIDKIKQFYSIVPREHKIEALTRFLEIENFTAAIVFTRTKNASSELAGKLEARGYSAAAINGDMAQSLREKVIKRLKDGSVDIIVATEVAARGLDVERISYVINYDIPYDVESYIHRIGRTGRAGREGKALVLVTPRERRMLKDIQRVTKNALIQLKPPTINEVQAKRLDNFSIDIATTLNDKDISYYRGFIQKIIENSQYSAVEVAAALAFLLQGENDLNENVYDELAQTTSDKRTRGKERKTYKDKKKQSSRHTEQGMTRCRIEVGRKHNINPGNIVGLIANKCDVKRQVVGQIQIYDDYTLVDIADKVVNRVFDSLQRCKLKNRHIHIKRAN